MILGLLRSRCQTVSDDGNYETNSKIFDPPGGSRNSRSWKFGGLYIFVFHYCCTWRFWWGRARCSPWWSRIYETNLYSGSNLLSLTLISLCMLDPWIKCHSWPAQTGIECGIVSFLLLFDVAGLHCWNCNVWVSCECTALNNKGRVW